MNCLFHLINSLVLLASHSSCLMLELFLKSPCLWTCIFFFILSFELSLKSHAYGTDVKTYDEGTKKKVCSCHSSLLIGKKRTYIMLLLSLNHNKIYHNCSSLWIGRKKEHTWIQNLLSPLLSPNWENVVKSALICSTHEQVVLK